MSPTFFCATRVYYAIRNFITWLCSDRPGASNISYHVLSDDWDVEDLAEMTRVPEDTIYIEEWRKDGLKRCVLFYEAEEIVRDVFDPFEEEPRVPWLWIGDKKTEVDLTSAMQKYMAVGNTIRLDLILHLIQVHYDTEIVYVDARTLEEVKFPAGGVKITAKDAVAQ